MMRLNILFVIAGLALFTVGCSQGGGTMSEAEREESKAKMEADMQQMTGQLTETPGGGQDEPAGEAPKAE